MSKIKIGRNEKCPCGSGKKYKNCCMTKNEINLVVKSEIEKYAQAENTIVSIIMKYLRSPENEKDFQKAIEEYFGGELSEINVNDVEFNFFMTWYIKNYNFEYSFIDRLIKKQKKTASYNIMQLLENLRASNLYLYKIIDLNNTKIIFKNLHTGSVIEIFDDMLGQNVNVDDVIYARIYKAGNLCKLFGGGMFIPDFMANEILSDIEQAWSASAQDIDYNDFIQIHSINVIKKLNTDIPDDRILYNEDEEMLQYSLTKYKILDRVKCSFVLDNMQDFAKKGDEVNIIYEWIKYKDNLKLILAEITISEEELKIETDSFERKEKIQNILTENLKDIIIFVDEEYSTIHQLQEDDDDELKTPDEIERLILDNMKIEYNSIQIRDAILLVKKHKANLKRLKPESVAAAIEYIISTKENLNKTQKDIADKYDVSAQTVSKWAKSIQEQSF